MKLRIGALGLGRIFSLGLARCAWVRSVVAVLAATGMAVAVAAPVASAQVRYSSGAFWAPCHVGVQSPVTNISARTESLAAASSGISTDVDVGAAEALVHVQSGASGGPVRAETRVSGTYLMPTATLCRDLDIHVEMASSVLMTASESFYYGRNQSAVLIETGLDPTDARPVQMEAGQLFIGPIELSGGQGRADADLSMRLLELRPFQAARILFDLELSTPDVTGQALLARSSTDQALADEIAAAFSYDAAADLYALPFFNSAALLFAAESLTGSYRNLLFTLDTALSVPEPLPLALLALALSLLWQQRRHAQGRR